jgi:hypothetical protein
VPGVSNTKPSVGTCAMVETISACMVIKNNITEAAGFFPRRTKNDPSPCIISCIVKSSGARVADPDNLFEL